MKSDRNEKLTVDLGSIYSISRVVISWHSFYAEEYKVQVSTNGADWKNARKIEGVGGGRHDLTFNSKDARYVRVKCMEPKSDNGYSIYEFEIYQ